MSSQLVIWSDRAGSDERMIYSETNKAAYSYSHLALERQVFISLPVRASSRFDKLDQLGLSPNLLR